jgi:hypothetical protein
MFFLRLFLWWFSNFLKFEQSLDSNFFKFEHYLDFLNVIFKFLNVLQVWRIYRFEFSNLNIFRLNIFKFEHFFDLKFLEPELF